MNETKKMLITIAVIVVLILVIPIVYYYNYSQGEKIVKNVNDLFKSNEKALVFIGRPTCSYCNLLHPSLDNLSENYKFEYNYVNTDKLSNSQTDKVISKFGLNPDNFGTPYLAIIENGNKIAEQNGYVEEEDLFAFLQTNGIIAEEAVYTGEKSNLNKINYQEYREILNKGEKEIIVIAQTGCGACDAAKPDLEAIAEEYKLKINWFDIRKITSEEDWNAFIDSLDYFQNEEWGTPLTLIIENKKVVDAFNGYYNKQAFIDFYNKNNFIK